MIEEIILDKTATFSEKAVVNPKRVNYFFGNNGSGKTTIGKVIEDISKHSFCSIKWKNNSIERLIYNKDFVDINFSDNSKIKGIFTLGKEANDAKTNIELKQATLNSNLGRLNGYESTLEEKQTELNNNLNNLETQCWAIKTLYSDKIKEALTGKIGSKNAFATECLNYTPNDNPIKPFDTIEVEYKNLYSSNLTKRESLELLDYSEIEEIESSSLLSEEIKGNDNLTVSELIDKLNNSDWVKQGLLFVEESDKKCPFCQQSIVDIEGTTVKELIEYFDGIYIEKCKKVGELLESYVNKCNEINTYLKSIIDENFNFFDYKNFNEYCTQLSLNFEKNKVKLTEKNNSPSKVIEIDKVDDLVKKINIEISAINEKIKSNNDKIDNIEQSKNTLKNDIWNFFVNELKTVISDYRKNVRNINSAKTNISDSISNLRLENKTLQSEIRTIESQITGITQTINEINKILQSFGFTGFKLIESDEVGCYKIIRENGDDVGKTLSEGEYRFISFLYFYQLIKGSNEKDGIVKDRIIVIDDPICSLDSSALFIVSTLVKNIIANCFEERDGIKQVFVLTHNVYFYKEITYRGSREQKKEKLESYFIVSKPNGISRVNEYKENPIQTTYQLLWDELKEGKEKNRGTVFNTMRRILEYYFNIIGEKDFEKCIDKFEGEEKILYKSLVSYINDGSHYINDDFSVVFEADTFDKYMLVFKGLFKEMGHINHYNMMMNIEDIE